MKKFIIICALIMFACYCLHENSTHSMEYSSEEDAASDMENFAWYQTYAEFSDEETALSNAVRNDRIDGIIKAVQNGADPNQFYDNPLAWAIKKSDYNLAKFLAEKGATIKQAIYGDTLVELIKKINDDATRNKFEKLFNINL